MRVLIFGDSHTACLKRGMDLLSVAGELPNDIEFVIRPFGNSSHYLTPFFVDTKDHVQITKIAASIRRLPTTSDDFALIFFSGSLNSTRIWRFGLGAFSPFSSDEKKIPVSKALLRRAVHDHTKHLLGFFKSLKAHGVNIEIIEGLRPFRHHSAVKPDNGRTVQYIDSFYREAVKAELERLGVPVLSLPHASYDDEKFTLDRFRHENPDDQQHANAEFGALVLREIVKRAQLFKAELASK